MRFQGKNDDAESADDCLDACRGDADCAFYSWNPAENDCFFFSDCDAQDECTNCISGQRECTLVNFGSFHLFPRQEMEEI